MKKTDTKKSHTVTIKRDESCEMMEICIDGKEWGNGNYWDFSDRDWIELLQKLGIKVVETTYKYDDGCGE